MTLFRALTLFLLSLSAIIGGSLALGETQYAKAPEADGYGSSDSVETVQNNSGDQPETTLILIRD